MTMRFLGCDEIAVMNDDTLDLLTPIMTLDNRINDFGPTLIEVINVIISLILDEMCTIFSLIHIP